MEEHTSLGNVSQEDSSRGINYIGTQNFHGFQGYNQGGQILIMQSLQELAQQKPIMSVEQFIEKVA